jgi:hypothetical protein
VDYATSDGTATQGSDYAATTGTLSFAPYVRSRSVLVPVSGDTTVETNERLTVTLANPANAVISRATGTGTILNDDR